MRFFGCAKLTSVKMGIAAFRMRQANQKSLEGSGEYIREAKQIIRRANEQVALKEKVKIMAIKLFRKCHENFGVIGLDSILKSLLKHLLDVPKVIVVDRATGKLTEREASS